MSNFSRFSDLAKDVLQGISLKVAIEVPGLFKIEFDAEKLRELMADRGEIAVTIHRCFLQRRLFSAPMKMEIIQHVCKSAEEIHFLLVKRADEYQKSGGAKRTHLELLLSWETATKRLIQAMDGRIAVVGPDVFVNHDPSSEAALRRYRVAALPLVEALAAWLPVESKSACNDELAKARNVLSALDVAKIDNAWNTLRV